MHLVVVCEDEGQAEEDLRGAEEDEGHPLRAELLDQEWDHFSLGFITLNLEQREERSYGPMTGKSVKGQERVGQMERYLGVNYILTALWLG